MKTILIFFCIFLLAGCDALKMDYVPTEEQIRKHYSAMLVEPISIQGIYANIDVDSVVFSYKSNNLSFQSRIIERLQAEKWHLQAISGSEIVATKSKPPGQGELQFYTLQLVKLSMNQGKVCVGYLQIDTNSEANMQTETVETKWASEKLWPKYESCKIT